MAENDRGPAGGEDPASAAAGPPVTTSRELLGTGRELVILHGPDRYRLTLTAQNKLILTK